MVCRPQALVKEIFMNTPVLAKNLNPIRVADLEVQAEAIIVDITAPSPVRERLLELGLSPGLTLRVLRRLPLAGPVIVQVGSLFLALRGDEAEQVWVK